MYPASAAAIAVDWRNKPVLNGEYIYNNSYEYSGSISLPIIHDSINKQLVSVSVSVNDLDPNGAIGVQVRATHTSTNGAWSKWRSRTGYSSNSVGRDRNTRIYISCTSNPLSGYSTDYYAQATLPKRVSNKPTKVYNYQVAEVE